MTSHFTDEQVKVEETCLKLVLALQGLTVVKVSPSHDWSLPSGSHWREWGVWMCDDWTQAGGTVTLTL